jgi:hypothetical protein
MTSAQETAASPWTLQDQLAFWFYRGGAYVLLNLIDEPAWLALIFC